MVENIFQTYSPLKQKDCSCTSIWVCIINVPVYFTGKNLDSLDSLRLVPLFIYHTHTQPFIVCGNNIGAPKMRYSFWMHYQIVFFVALTLFALF